LSLPVSYTQFSIILEGTGLNHHAGFCDSMLIRIMHNPGSNN